MASKPWKIVRDVKAVGNLLNNGAFLPDLMDFAKAGLGRNVGGYLLEENNSSKRTKLNIVGNQENPIEFENKKLVLSKLSKKRITDNAIKKQEAWQKNKDTKAKLKDNKRKSALKLKAKNTKKRAKLNAAKAKARRKSTPIKKRSVSNKGSK